MLVTDSKIKVYNLLLSFDGGGQVVEPFLRNVELSLENK